MSACPNCGQETARTEDWACRWCGYPLTSGSYKKIAKTYKELQEGGSHGLLVEEEEEEEEEYLLPEPTPSPRYRTEPQAEPIEEPVFEPELTGETETAKKFEPEPEAVKEFEAVKEAEPVEVSEPEQVEAAEKVTVDDLILAYEEDSAAADARFGGRVIDVTGVVARVETGDFLDVHFIILASADQRRVQSIRCLFDKKHGAELSKLARGQTVTVRGTYYGSIIDIRLKNCIIVG
jgi:hypothetical protein